MVDISLMNEIEIYIIRIFGFKTNRIKNENFYFEKILKKIEKFDSEEEKIFYILKILLKRIFDFNKEIESELFSKTFVEFSNKLYITREEFEKIFELAKKEKESEYYNSPEIKKLISEIKSELPIINTRVYNIHLGIYTKANGEEITLREYSLLTGEDYESVKNILKSTQILIAKKLKRRLKG